MRWDLKPEGIHAIPRVRAHPSVTVAFGDNEDGGSIQAHRELAHLCGESVRAQLSRYSVALPKRPRLALSALNPEEV